MRSINIEYEMGSGHTFDIMEEIDGFWICYYTEGLNGQKLGKSDLLALVKKIMSVMKDLGIQAPRFALEVVHNGRRAAACSVDKQRDIIYLLLPAYYRDGRLTIPSREIHEDYILYHELMHAKDCLEYRFPSKGYMDFEENPREFLVGSAWNFSIEGRLEGSGKPHYSQEISIQNEYQSFVEMCRARYILKGHSSSMQSFFESKRVHSVRKLSSPPVRR